MHHFYLGVPARQRESRHVRARNQMPPRRRAFRSNVRQLFQMVLDSFSLWANLQRFTSVPPPAISTSIPHASSLNTIPVTRRTTHKLVSWFSCAAIFPRTIPSPHLLRFVWCYKKEGLFEADSITLSFSIQTCSEGTPFSVTPHGRVGWEDGTDTLSRRGSRHQRCMKLARRERETLEKCGVYPGLVPSCI
jgi:hypothetical protein